MGHAKCCVYEDSFCRYTSTYCFGSLFIQRPFAKSLCCNICPGLLKLAISYKTENSLFNDYTVCNMQQWSVYLVHTVQASSFPAVYGGQAIPPHVASTW